MLKKSKKSFRGYIRSSKAWYYDSEIQPHIEVDFGIYHSTGKTLGEITIIWERIGNKSSPRLSVFDDSWGVFGQLWDLIKTLAKYNDMDITEEEFVSVLDKHGFKDITPYEKPE